jgi:hypothetical protein
MKTLIGVVATAVALTGCECGPGVACKDDTQCPSWGRCASGFCVSRTGGESGTPLAVLSEDHFDFGPLPCGGASRTHELSLTNGGTATLSFQAQLSSTAFSISPPEGTVGPGLTVKLTVASSTPASLAAGVDLKGTLTVTTNDLNHPKLEVPISSKSEGVTLTLTPGLAPLGVVPVNTDAPPASLTLTNTGNIRATVSFVQPADSQFSLTWTGAPAVVQLAPGDSVPALTAHFKPTKNSPGSTSAGIEVTQAVCGASVTSIPMTGQGTNGVVGFSATDLFFGTNGQVNCGAQAPAKTFVLRNTGNLSFSWTGTLAKGAASPFMFSPTSGIVLANTGMTTITVTPAAIPGVATTVMDAFGDTLQIVTDVANDTSHPIALHQTATGAVVRFGTASVDFGTVPVNNTATAPFGLINEGNAPITLTLASDDPKFSVNPTGPIAADGGVNVPIVATFAPDASVGLEEANISVSGNVGAVLCAPLPAALTMSGSGTTGSVSYTPAVLDFGAVPCGTTGASKTVTFRNDGNQSYTIVATLGKDAGSPYTLALNPTSGVVAQDGGTVVITVAPKAIPQTSPVTPDLFGDTLTVTTDVSGDTAHNVALHQTASGSIFAISTNAINFGSVAVGAMASSQFTLSNTGNAPGSISFTAVQPKIFSMPVDSVLAANSSAIATGGFSPNAVTSYSDMATVSVSATTVLCQPLPLSTVMLSGAGTSSNVLMLSASSLNFGLVPCGSQTPAQKINVTNNSTQTLTISLTLMGGGSSPYAVSGPATISAGATAAITVTPKPIPAVSSTAADGFADTLSITATGGPVNESHAVALHETASGAILSFNPTSLTFTATGSKTFTVNNEGNVVAPYMLTLLQGGQTAFTVSPAMASVNGGGSVSETVGYKAPLFGARSGTISVATSAPRCAPLPAALTLSN